MLHNLASELGYKLVGINKLGRDEVSKLIDDYKIEASNKQAEEKAKEQQELIKE
tara:strand:- start:255 stop:416 length:162 start_codon:yes stop_codon:yes gene_type:complete